MEGEVKGKTFKLKGHTLPGINQRSETKNLADGRSKSSTFQRGIGDYEGKGSFNLQVDPAMAAQPIQQVPAQTPIMDKNAPTKMFGALGAAKTMFGGGRKSGKTNPLGMLGAGGGVLSGLF
tara:strand:+ start:245 stop:607 length:363 start_codon:yes stop_codon:yes gene_type:complete